MLGEAEEMKQIVILSGKGGTGKTSIAAALAHLASQSARVVLADADVDAANLELVLAPTKRRVQDFKSGQVARVDPGICTGCGLCEAVCRFGALHPVSTDADDIGRYAVDPIACEGCAACTYQCPLEAISLEEELSGQWFLSDTRFGPLVHAHLFAAQENSGKLVTLVKQQARDLGLAQGTDYLLVDGPPGIGCPVIATCAGADLALLVTEPTVAAVHDLKRVLATTDHFRVPALVCMNKADLNEARAAEIERFCESLAIDVVGRIPYDTTVTNAMVVGKAITEFTDGCVSREVSRVWERVTEFISARSEY